MSKRISSSGWTGSLDEQVRPRASTHRIGDHSISSDYRRIAEAQRIAALVPPEVRSVRWLAFIALLSPIALWLAWLLVAYISHDALARDHSGFLTFWGLGVMALAAWQLRSRSAVLIGLRKAFLVALMASTVAIAAAYGYFGIDANAQVVASAPERTFELYRVRGKRPFKKVITWHQRPDGSTVEGINQGRPVPYASTCALVQRLDGPYGFSWVRVLDRSRPPARGQLAWPVRREECFSNIPLSTLPR